MKNWYAKKRGTMQELNDWLKILPTKEGNFTKVEETISMTFCSSPDIYEILIRLSGPHFHN